MNIIIIIVIVIFTIISYVLDLSRYLVSLRNCPCEVINH